MIIFEVKYQPQGGGLQGVGRGGKTIPARLSNIAIAIAIIIMPLNENFCSVLRSGVRLPQVDSREKVRLLSLYHRHLHHHHHHHHHHHFKQEYHKKRHCAMTPIL